MAFKRGIVKSLIIADGQPPKATVLFPDHDQMVSMPLHIAQRYTGSNKAFWTPAVGEQVGCDMDERMEDGAVVYSIYSQADLPVAGLTGDDDHVQYADGAVTGYNTQSHAFQLTLPAGGDWRIEVDGTIVEISADHQLTIATGGDVIISSAGNIILQGGAQPVARIGDTVVCPAGEGHITTGNETVLA